ncbi:MAG TPA: Asp-tRNA(Asn)/Glu-tRNA(Gln) amidotransferase subunit GatA [Vicinamibacterales bacterium]|nr:Asp-tRNA(Asn)/Glu-tRNA(Gln) amidotransferase subunit GatA [Vicinamibacterales bacterium]
MDLRSLSAHDLRAAIERGETSAEAAVQSALDAIAAEDRKLHAFLTVAGDRALARARQLDTSGDRRGRLHGVPVALKDNLCVRGMKTTAGSRILGDYAPPYNATAVERLEAEGAVVIGKTNCDEFAMGSSTEHSAFGPSRNPWDPERIPGGSSGGSAVSVAARFTPIALGSDTGGSVRQPAALCGVVGAKPTYGRVSRYGLLAFASSLDQIGPFARTVADAALVQDVIDGPDPRDATCGTHAAAPCSSKIDRGVEGLRIGVPRHLLERGVDAEVSAAFERALSALAASGASVRAVELTHSEHAIAVYYLVATAEASSNLARYDGVRYGARVEGGSLAALYAGTRSRGFGAEVKRRLMLGTYALSAGYYDAYYLKAQQVRTLIRRDFERAFEHVDAIALPTSPTPAFKLGERLDDPLQMYLADVFTVGPSLAGLPAISVPCGLTAGRLPVGLQITGRAWDDATVYQIAAAFERTNEGRVL